MPRSGKRNLYGIMAGWLLCGALHVLLYNKDFCIEFSRYFCAVFLLVWSISIHKRVTNRHLHALLLSIAAFAGLRILFQMIQYNLLVFFPTADRLLDYATYLPMTALPLLCLYTALQVWRPEEEKLSPVSCLPAVIGAVLVTGIMTNDLHAWFRLAPGTAAQRNGWLFYAAHAYIYGLYSAALVILWRKSRLCHVRDRWAAVVPLAMGILYSALRPLNIAPTLIGFRVWNVAEMLAFCLIAALEACIQAGMIPANTDSDKLFAQNDLSAVIIDSQGRVKYASGAAEYPFPEKESVQILRQPIAGGEIVRQVDLSDLMELNSNLEETARVLEARNDYLKEEVRIKAEKTELETRNAIYDRITQIVRPQLDRISGLLEDTELPFEKKLRTITVMCTYIKRRSNMELVEKDGRLPLDEMRMAVLESEETMKLCGIRTACMARSGGYCASQMVKEAYEQIEKVIEDCFETMKGLVVFIEGSENSLSVRMLLTTDSLTLPITGKPASPDSLVRSVSVTKEGQDMILQFTYGAGGESA